MKTNTHALIMVVALLAMAAQAPADWQLLPQPLPAPLYDSGMVPLNGDLFIYGGATPQGATSAAYFYPVDGSPPVVAADMPDVRQAVGFTTHLIDGQVRPVAVGGYKPQDDPGPAFGRKREVWSYGSAANSWNTNHPLLPTPRQCPRAVSAGEHIYAIGGHDEGTVPQSLKRMDRWNPNAPGGGTWTPMAPMYEDREYFGAEEVGGLIIIMGGQHQGIGSDYWVRGTMEAYDWAANAWYRNGQGGQVLPPMPTPRMAFATAVLGDQIWTIGGLVQPTPGVPGQPTNVVEVFDTGTRQWFSADPLPVAAAYLEGAVIDGTIYVAGGTSTGGSDGALNTVYRLPEPASLTLLLLGALVAIRRHRAGA